MEIRKAYHDELGKIKRLYLEAFPRVERKPFGMMRRMARRGEMEILSVIEDGKLKGLAITVLYKDLVLLDYFATNKIFRGQNVGSRALALLKERYAGRKIVFEIERADLPGPGQELRARRKQFYLRNGVQELGIRVLVFGVPMELLWMGKPYCYEEYHGIYETIIGPSFARKVTRDGEF